MDTKETATYHAVLIAAAVIGSIITYFILSIIRQQRRHRRFLKAGIGEQITTLEKERARVAADLHDELGPTLSAVKFKISSIENLCNNDNSMRNDAIRYIDSILLQVRNIANDLVPDTLLRNGIPDAIEDFIHTTAAGNHLRISFNRSRLPPLPHHWQIHIYRIVQEIIHNTIKHANAHRLKLGIFTRNNKLVIASADDGKGFNYRKVLENNHGQGLVNLRNRTELLGGEIHIKTNPQRGTQITIEIPLPHN